MILDGDSSHTAAKSQQHAANLEIMLEWLPVRSPEFNAIEDIWGDAKQVVCANHQFSDIETQCDAFLDYIEDHSNQQAKRKAGLLADNYWLFQLDVQLLFSTRLGRCERFFRRQSVSRWEMARRSSRLQFAFPVGPRSAKH